MSDSNSTFIPQMVGGVTEGITALAGGANTGSTPVMAHGINIVGTVGTLGDSVALPANIAQHGRVIVANNAALKMDVFPNAGAAINAAADDANLGVAAITVAEFIQVGTDGLTWAAIGVSVAQT